MDMDLVLIQADGMRCNTQSNIHCFFVAKQLSALHLIQQCLWYVQDILARSMEAVNNGKIV